MLIPSRILDEKRPIEQANRDPLMPVRISKPNPEYSFIQLRKLKKLKNEKKVKNKKNKILIFLTNLGKIKAKMNIDKVIKGKVYFKIIRWLL